MLSNTLHRSVYPVDQDQQFFDEVFVLFLGRYRKVLTGDVSSFVHTIVETKTFSVKVDTDWTFTKIWSFVYMFPSKCLLIIFAIIAQPFLDKFLVVNLSFLGIFKLLLFLFDWFFQRTRTRTRISTRRRFHFIDQTYCGWKRLVELSDKNRVEQRVKF